jgi:hypothetical protein
MGHGEVCRKSSTLTLANGATKIEKVGLHQNGATFEADIHVQPRVAMQASNAELHPIEHGT